MIHTLHDCKLRPPEPRDAERLFEFKNDCQVAGFLGGFHTGLAVRDIEEWIESRRKAQSDIVWVVANSDDQCLGHVGFYQLDYRIRSGEFGIMIGDKASWGQGLGRAVTEYVVRWGFEQLNLNRICLSVLDSNERAIALYRSIGFRDEGKLREAQYKEGRYHDVLLMSLLRSEWSDASR